MIALLVDVEALHSSLKSAGRKPEEAAVFFANVGDGVARRAVACATRKQKVRVALKGIGFDVEQVNDGGSEAARLRLALDAMEFALAHRGAKIYLFDPAADAQSSDDESAPASGQENAVLTERLRHHGAEVTYFSLRERLSIGQEAKRPPADNDAPAANEGESETENNASAPAAKTGDSDDSGDGEASTGRRRRRRGRRGRGADRDSDGAESTDRSDAQSADADTPQEDGAQSRPPAPAPARKSTSDPLALLTSAIGQLAKGESQLVWATKARQEMSALDPLFSETEHGYENFEALLREAERRGRVVLQKDPRTQTFVIVGWRAA